MRNIFFTFFLIWWRIIITTPTNIIKKWVGESESGSHNIAGLETNSSPVKLLDIKKTHSNRQDFNHQHAFAHATKGNFIHS